ncbi:uncharacterized protein LOC114531379 [Dendronephthya gigantea]|uniref:uncharacterized protein LOC114531379 n=1 Tax=Dendronephthya gigantea TaxID=151771 RepID=UPI00106C8D0E|nr:uncharacterized protein LOC114531379 [Dendronephthya gigantea]
MEVVKFAGDLKEYWRFATRFKDQVLSQPISESKKLSRLMQYLDGKAKEAVEDYEGMGDGALQEALKVIETHFGQPYMIVDASIGSLVKGPNINSGDGKGLQKLADKCQFVYKTLKAMKCLSEVNTDHMRRLVARLPYHYQAKWRDRASSILKSRSKLPSFFDLVEFLQERASFENNPVFGYLKDLNKTEVIRKKRYSDSNTNASRISSFATQFAPKHVRHHRLLHLNNQEPKKEQINVDKSEHRKVITCDANVQTNAANVVPDVYKGATALPVVAVVVRGPVSS